MTAIMSQLHQDHLNLSRLLDLLKEKSDRLQAGERPDYRLMLDVVNYIVDYADQHHHPLEDQIYTYAASHYPENAARLDAVGQEHRRIGEQTSAFQELLGSILQDTVVPMSQFQQQLDDFIQQQSRHLNQEEGVIFPLLEQVLQPADWEVLEQQLLSRPDPLFGDQIADEYRHLYKSLLQQDAVA